MEKPRLTEAEIDAANAKFAQHVERTWAMMGRCVSRYQECDDFIEFVFISMWSASVRPQIRAVYSALGNRDLATRCKVVTGAIEAGPTPNLVGEWKSLVAALKQGSDRRAEYAHAQSVTFGGGIAIEFDEETGAATGARRFGPQELQLRRLRPNDIRVWTLVGLEEEYERLTVLLANLHQFAAKLISASQPESDRSALP